MASSSHVKCRGQYEGCLGTAERRQPDQMCKNCHRVQEPHRKGSFRGSVRHAVMQQVDPDRAEAEARGLHIASLEETLHSASNGVLASEVEGILFERTGMPLDPSIDVYEDIRRDADEIRSWRKRPTDAPPAILTVVAPEGLSEEQREEIRELSRTGAATAAELQDTYHLGDGVLDQILAEPEAPAPEPVRHRRPGGGRQTAEHMEKMRAAKQAKRDAQDAELARLRALVVEQPAVVAPPLPSSARAWKVTILRPTEVTVYADSFPAAMAGAQAEYQVEPGQILGIVQA